jgi:Flp pilus assembly pilin Flp
MTIKTEVKPMPLPSSRITPSGEETIMDLIGKFSGDESGATAVEYALMIMCIALAVFAAVQAFGAAVRGLFEMQYPSGS